MAGNFTLFVISRIIGGLAKGNVSLSTAVVADVYKSHERGKGMVSLQAGDHRNFFVEER